MSYLPPAQNKPGMWYCSGPHPIDHAATIRHVLEIASPYIGYQPGLSEDDAVVALVALLAEKQQAEEFANELHSRLVAQVEVVRQAEQRVEQLQERDELLRKQLDGAIDAAEAVAYTVGLATARAVVSDLKNARAALAVPEEKNNA